MFRKNQDQGAVQDPGRRQHHHKSHLKWLILQLTPNQLVPKHLSYTPSLARLSRPARPARRVCLARPLYPTHPLHPAMTKQKTARDQQKFR